jgi:hypothetical protein
MIENESSSLVLDVNVWLDTIGPLAALSRWEDLADIEATGVRANAARSVRGLVRAHTNPNGSKVIVCASTHILDLVFEKLQSSYGWTRTDAAHAVSQIALFCKATGGSYDVDARSALSTVNASVSMKHQVSNRRNMEADIDFEDMMVLATAAAVNAKFLVTNDGGLQQMHTTMYRRFNLAVIYPKQLVAAMGRAA